MAEEDKKEAEEAGEGRSRQGTSPRVKRGALFGGGVLGLVAVAYVTSLMALPGEVEDKLFAGPFVAPLSEEKIQVNLAGEGSRRYLVMSLNAVYDAYEETYFATRLLDPLYAPLLQDALIDIGSQKTREEISSIADRDVFKQEIRAAVEPILFPVHVGNAVTPYDADSASGLRPGDSMHAATLRGPLYEHVIRLDAVGKTIQLDEGDVVTYAGDETDLELVSPDGRVVSVDVTDVKGDFQGEVPVGVHGRVRRVTFSELLVQ